VRKSDQLGFEHVLFAQSPSVPMDDGSRSFYIHESGTGIGPALSLASFRGPRIAAIMRAMLGLPPPIPMPLLAGVLAIILVSVVRYRSR
jgi:hypothetical protein